MPRLRRLEATAGQVPAALQDRAAHEWQSRRAFDRWCVAQRLAPQPFTDYGPLSRLNAAVEAWAIEHGLANAWGRPRWDELCRRGVAYPVGRIRERMRKE